MPPRDKCSRLLLIEAGAVLLMQSREHFYMCQVKVYKNTNFRFLYVVQILLTLFSHQTYCAHVEPRLQCLKFDILGTMLIFLQVRILILHFVSVQYKLHKALG